MVANALAWFGTLVTAIVGLLSKLCYGWIKEWLAGRKKRKVVPMLDDRSVVGHLIECIVIDDDIQDAALLLRLLATDKERQRIKVFTNAQEAKDFLLKTGDYADRMSLVALRLIILDLGLRGISGIEMLKLIKEDEVLKSIPVVVFSGTNREKDLVECYRAGGNSFIQKSSDFQKFERDVASIRTYWLGTNQMFIFDESRRSKTSKTGG